MLRKLENALLNNTTNQSDDSYVQEPGNCVCSIKLNIFLLWFKLVFEPRQKKTNVLHIRK